MTVLKWILVPSVLLALFASKTLGFGLIVEPSGVVLFDGSDPAEWDTAKKIGGLNFQFFGNTISELWVSENGYISNRSAIEFFPDPLGSPSNFRIAALWDDFLLFQDPQNPIDNRVLAQHIPGQYLAVTWQNVLLHLETIAGQPFPETSRTVQAVLFETDTQIRGFQFLANDIAFGYIPHDAVTNSMGDIYATVGLDSGNGVITPLPGTIDGYIEQSNSNLLATDWNNFLLFRPTGGATPGYTASTEYFVTAIPEPTSAALLGVAGLMLVFRRVRRFKHPLI